MGFFSKTLQAAMPKMIGNPITTAVAMVSVALSVVKGKKATKATKNKKKATVKKSKIMSKKQQMEVMERICQSVYGTYIRGATTIAARYIGHPAVAIPASEMVKTMMDEVAPPINKYCVIHTEQKQKIETNDIVQIAQIYKNAIEETKQYLKDKKLYIPTVNDYLLTGYNGTIQSVQYLMDKYCPELGETLDNIKAKKAEMISYFYENNRQIYIKNPEIGTVFDKMLFDVPIDEKNMNVFEKAEVAMDGVASGFIKDIASGANAIVDMALSPLDTAEALTSPGTLTLGTVWNGLTEDIVNDWQKGTIQGKSEAVGRTASVALPFLGVISKITKATGTAGKLTGTAAREAAERATQEAAERAAQEATERAAQEAAERAAQEATERAAQEAAERAAQEAAERAAQEAAERTAQETTERAGKEVSQEVAERARKTDNSIPVKRGDSSTNGSGVKISEEKPNHNIDNVKITEANGNELREDGIQTNNVTEQPKIQVTKQPQKPQIQNTNIHKHTMPSQPPNILATPNGTKTKVNYNDPELDNIRSLIRENEAAETLAQAGYKIEQNPKVPGTKNPDYLIENKIFDCYSPREGTSVRNIASSITRKIDSGQTNRIILNLDDWHGGGGDIDEIIKQLNEWSIPGLKEVKVINHYHEIIDIYP
jgi:hypothetical protein